MKCKSCGNENPEDAVYCGKCGGKQGDDIKVKIQREVKVKRGPSAAVAPRATATVKRTVSMPGMCFYHQQLPATYVCSRCGRSICHSCSSFVGSLAFCPHCRRF